MGFRFSTAAPTQHTASLAILGLAIAVGGTGWGQAAWAAWVGDRSAQVLVTGGLMLLHTALFWTVALAFHWVDTHDQPAFIARYRIQRDNRKHPDFWTTVRVLCRNQFLMLPVLLAIFVELLVRLRGWVPEAELPTVGRFLLEIGGQALIAPIVFYAGHRFLHRKWWMRHVHRVHHEFRTTTALASEYAHPVEFVIGNFLALTVGAFVLAPHLVSMYLFATVSVLTILVHHSGYALPWASWAVPHDWHHYRMSELFGTTGFLDNVLGTDAVFRTLEDGDER